MNTKNDAAVPGQSVSVEDESLQQEVPVTGARRVRKVLWRLGAAALVAVVAFSQSNSLQIVPLAQGTDPEHNVVLHMKGATDVLQADLIFRPDLAPDGTFIRVP